MGRRGTAGQHERALGGGAADAHADEPVAAERVRTETEVEVDGRRGRRGEQRIVDGAARNEELARAVNGGVKSIDAFEPLSGNRRRARHVRVPRDGAARGIETVGPPAPVVRPVFGDEVEFVSVAVGRAGDVRRRHEERPGAGGVRGQPVLEAIRRTAGAQRGVRAYRAVRNAKDEAEGRRADDDGDRGRNDRFDERKPAFAVRHPQGSARPPKKRAAMELRPLGFGEIFDRAITLYVRNFIPFAGIVSIVIVPLAVVQYFLDASSAPSWDAMMQILTHPGAPAPTKMPPTIFDSPGSLALVFVAVAVTWMIWPFALNACAIGVARLYRGRPVEFSACYKTSLRRWPQVIGLLMVDAFVFIVWYLTLVIAVMVVILLAFVLVRASAAAGVIGGVFAILVMLMALLTLAPLFVALTFSMNSVVIEERPVFESVGLGFSRIFNRKEFWRSILFSIAAFAVMMGASMVTGVITVIAMMFHQVWLEVIVSSATRAAVAPFSIVLLAIYYFDVRIRREGFDLEAGLDQLANPVTAA